MKKIVLILVLILICFLLTGCDDSIVDQMGDRFVEIESDGKTALCYDKDTMAVYVIFDGYHQCGMSPYIMFDEYNQPTVGKWNGKEIVPAMMEYDEAFVKMGKGGETSK